MEVGKMEDILINHEQRISSSEQQIRVLEELTLAVKQQGDVLIELSTSYKLLESRLKDNKQFWLGVGASIVMLLVTYLANTYLLK